MQTLPAGIVAQAGGRTGSAQDWQGSHDTSGGRGHAGAALMAPIPLAHVGGAGVYDAASYGHQLHTLRLHPDWPDALRTLHTAAYGAWLAVEGLESLAGAARWNDAALTRAYHVAFDTLDQVESAAAPMLAAWERGERGTRENGGAA